MRGVALCVVLLMALGTTGGQAGVLQRQRSNAAEQATFLFRGQPFSSFERPLPQVVEAQLFRRFHRLYNQSQAFDAEGRNTYRPQGQQFVAEVEGGSVTGILGTVFDATGSELTVTLATASEGARTGPPQCTHHFKRLATPVQKYGHMYWHFMQEVLPRILLLRPFLDSDTQLLVFGAPHEAPWLEALGIPSSQLVVYNPSHRYCAEQLLVPSSSQVMAPPRENYELLRTAFHADPPLPDSQRDVIVYSSRSAAADRHVSNEAQLLTAIRAQHPSSQLAVFTGSESPAETVALFRRARLIVGIHGAGLSHMAFAAPGTPVVEFLFMSEPPLLFWHAAAALRQRYVMVPLPQSWWLEQDVEVPVQDVLDALALALGDGDADAGPRLCEEGNYFDSGAGECLECAAGSYRPASAREAGACAPCAPGRVAGKAASGSCSTCDVGSYSDTLGRACLPCPEGTSTLFPGSASADSCLAFDELDRLADRMYSDDVVISKLVSIRALDVELAGSWAPRQGEGSRGLVGLAERLVQTLSPFRMVRRCRVAQLKKEYLKVLLEDDEEDEREERAVVEGAEENKAGRQASEEEETEEAEEAGEEEEEEPEGEFMEEEEEPGEEEEEEEEGEFMEEEEEEEAKVQDWDDGEELAEEEGRDKEALGEEEEAEEEVDGQARRHLQSRYRRSMQSGYRRSLQSGYRRSMQSGYRRSMQSGYRRSMQSGYRRSLQSGYRRSLQSGYRRSMQSGYRRSMQSGYRRSMQSGYRRSMQSGYRRSMQAGYRRSMQSGYRRSLQSGYARLLASYRRSMQSGYRRFLSGTTSHPRAGGTVGGASSQLWQARQAGAVATRRGLLGTHRSQPERWNRALERAQRAMGL